MKPTLSEKVYTALKLIPRGKVTTYKHLGDFVGTKGYRAIGSILNKNPDAPITPCHRVVSTGGKIGGYAGGVAAKQRMLLAEGVECHLVGNDPHIKNFASVLFDFSSIKK